MSFTSKRMQKLAQYYYALKHPDASVRVMITPNNQDTIVKFHQNSLQGIKKYFTNCIRNVIITLSKDRIFKRECINIGPVYDFLESKCYGKLDCLKLKKLLSFNEDSVPSDNVKKQLESIQIVEIVYVECAPSTYKSLLKYCVNLKTLDIEWSGDYINDPGWLAYEYPFLETLKLPYIVKESLSVDNFILRHKQLKNVTGRGIDTMKSVFRNLKHIDLDHFMCCLREDDDIDLGDSFKCYERKSSIKLFEFDTMQSRKDITSMFIDEDNSVQPIHKLSCSIRREWSSQEFPKLKQLKQLNFTLDFTLNGMQVVEFLNDLSKSVPELEELVVVFGKSKFKFKSAALPFFLHSPKLKEVEFRFRDISSEAMFDRSDLVELDSIRRSNHGESKIEFIINNNNNERFLQYETFEPFNSPGKMPTVAVTVVPYCPIYQPNFEYL